jgi:putative toxin-antitoxin system antitoxin component (TIGR02293 family)
MPLCAKRYEITMKPNSLPIESLLSAFILPLVYSRMSGGMSDATLKTFHVPPLQPTVYGESIGLHETDTADLILTLKRGLTVASFEQLQGALGLPKAELAKVVGITERTLARRFKTGHFSAEESERIYRVAKLYDKAKEVLETGEEAALWLKTPKRYLSGRTPLQYADTEVGAQTVERLLGRIEHGVFS